MTPAERAQVQAVTSQVAALKEQALALSMQADTLQRTLHALVDATPLESERSGLIAEPPMKVRHFNQPPPNSTAVPVP